MIVITLLVGILFSKIRCEGDDIYFFHSLICSYKCKKKLVIGYYISNFFLSLPLRNFSQLLWLPTKMH